MNIGSLFVTFFSALLYGILSAGDSDTGMVSLFFCLPVTLICTIVGLIKSEGKTKLLVIPVQIVIWIVCILLGTSIFKGLLAIAIIAVAAFLIIRYVVPIFTSEKDEEKDVPEPEPASSFSDRLPDILLDDDGNRWERDYIGPNISRYHCTALGQSTELIEGATQIYGQGDVRGSDGRTYHWQ